MEIKSLIYFKGFEPQAITAFAYHSDTCVEFESARGKYLYMEPGFIIFDIAPIPNTSRTNFYRYSPENDYYIPAPEIEMVILPAGKGGVSWYAQNAEDE